MHELINFACTELEELESKAKKGNLSMADIQYADTLAHMKKNLLTSDAMEKGSSHGYSRNAMGSYDRSYGMSYARQGRDGDGDGRYSEDNYSRGSSYDNSYRYSRDDKSSMVNKLMSMASNAMNENDRLAIMDCADKIKLS